MTDLKREFTYKDSRIDFLIETDLEEKLLVEVKGMTLEADKVGSFPDAPTLRGLKHVETLIDAKEDGYLRAVLFVVQFESVDVATINKEMQPDLQVAFQSGMEQGLEVLAYNCNVTPDEVTIKEQVSFKLF